jgi:hypothetical protein
MIRNNYTKNADGLSVEASVFYDTCLSRQYYEENFATLCTDSRCDASLLFYCDYGNLEVPTIIGDVAVIRKNVSNYDLTYFVEGYTCNRGELMNIVKNTGVRRLEEALDDLVKLKDGYKIITSRGYCQGDCVDVLVPIKHLTKMWGRAPEDKELREVIDHLLWDTPIYCSVTIEDETWEYSELDLDEYSYDKQKVIEKINEKSKYKGEELVKELNRLLPDNPDYN